MKYLGLLWLLSSISQAESLPSAEVTHVDREGIEIDGSAADAVWLRARWVDGFIQQEPNPGGAPSEKTRVKIAYDESAIYFLVEAHDSDAANIRGRLTRRDEESASDWIHVWLDTFDDDRSAYRFSVNPVDVKQDARVSDEDEDVDWNGVWEVKTRTSSAGWTAELRIPLSELRYESGQDQWGFQVARHLSRLGETSYFSSIPAGSATFVRHFGYLRGLQKLPSSWALSLEPHLLGSTSSGPDGREFSGTGGGEARLGLGASMNLSLSVNPDFGDVEADPSVLNLSAREIFFAEKRPFFQEGKELLDFQLGFGADGQQTNLFYTRRIGRTAPILGAVKLTGRTADGWSIGVLDALTGRGEETLEPLSNAAVARVSRDFNDGLTTVGLMGTHLLRAREEMFISQASSGGADFSHRIDDYQLVLNVFGSDIRGSSASIEEVQRASVHYFQRPDASHLRLDPSRESLSGWGATMIAGKTSGTDWRGGLALGLTSPGFDPNPLGYLHRADTQQILTWLQLREDEPGELHRNYQVGATAWARRTWGGEITEVAGEVTASWTFPDTSSLYCGTVRSVEALDVDALFGGPALKRPGAWFLWIGGASDERASMSLSGELYFEQRDNDAGRTIGAVMSFSARPASSLELSLEPTLEKHVLDYQWADELDGAPIVAHLDQTIASVAARLSWTLLPELSLQIYAAPYLTAGQYSRFREATAPRAERYTDRFSAIDYDGGDRFVVGELRSNFVLRWEYALGSTLFLVWSHEQALVDERFGALRLGRDFRSLLDAEATDTVMAKLSYWFAL